MRLAIIADTHLPKGSRKLPEQCLRELARADAIVHLGDFSTLDVLEELRAIGPSVEGVHGNVDSPQVRRALPERLTLDLEGVRIGLVHDAGRRRGRLERLRRAFPDAGAVLFGHSHLPWHETAKDGFQIFNPGSPTERRRAPHRSMGRGTISAGTLRLVHVRLGARAGRGAS